MFISRRESSKETLEEDREIEVGVKLLLFQDRSSPTDVSFSKRLTTCLSFQGTNWLSMFSVSGEWKYFPLMQRGASWNQLPWILLGFVKHVGRQGSVLFETKFTQNN